MDGSRRATPSRRGFASLAHEPERVSSRRANELSVSDRSTMVTHSDMLSPLPSEYGPQYGRGLSQQGPSGNQHHLGGNMYKSTDNTESVEARGANESSDAPETAIPQDLWPRTASRRRLEPQIPFTGSQPPSSRFVQEETAVPKDLWPKKAGHADRTARDQGSQSADVQQAAILTTGASGSQQRDFESVNSAKNIKRAPDALVADLRTVSPPHGRDESSHLGSRAPKRNVATGGSDTASSGAGDSHQGPAAGPLFGSALPSKEQHPTDARSHGSGQQRGLVQSTPLDGFSRARHGKRYRLEVVQQPERARMCGYGDKDRRPLSPSLIVKLFILDEATGKQISPWDVNTSLFFLASDLCDPEELMRAPRNLLLNTQLASIPSSMLQATRPPETARGPSAAAAAAVSGNLNFSSLQSMQMGEGSPYEQQYGHGVSRSAPDDVRATPPGPRGYVPASSRTSSGLTPLTSASDQQQRSQDQHSTTTTVSTEHYARNLVGAAVTSANILRDEKDDYQIFFVLQDLSVRAEGTYRIRLLFTDLSQEEGQTNERVSEALAEVYTDPFSVYTPRRFPGMLEPTELSKKLASQGIKIAVRSDKKKRQRDSGSRAADAGPSGVASGSGQMGDEERIAGGASGREDRVGAIEYDDMEDDDYDD